MHELAPYVPVIPPRGTYAWPPLVAPPPLAADEIPPLAPATPEDGSVDTRAELKKTFLLWGTLGVVAGAALNAGITAAAFGQYRKTGSIRGPALATGLGSLVVGGLLLYTLSRTFDKPVDNRILSTVVGAKLAY